ncbi:MAG: hypothetical protein IPM64_17965 [Phycisphaerales bacterium]|nr:hypothetical protein [Phycisphaerales bacterium]
MTVSVNPTFRSNASRTTDPTGSAEYTISYNETDRTTPKFDADTTPPVTELAAGQITPGAGTSTLNLAAIPDTPSNQTLDLTGIKVVYCRFSCPTTNGAVVKVKPGASNPYNLQGGEEIWVYPGGQHELVLRDGLTDVAAGARTLDCVGSVAGDKLNYLFAAG